MMSLLVCKCDVCVCVRECARARTCVLACAEPSASGHRDLASCETRFTRRRRTIHGTWGRERQAGCLQLYGMSDVAGAGALGLGVAVRAKRGC